jgi:hypothetical protein
VVSAHAGLERFLEETAVGLAGEALKDPDLNAALGTALRAPFLIFKQMLAKLQKAGCICADYNVGVGAFRLHAISVGIIFWHYHDNAISTSEVQALFKEELERMAPST